jgi:diguanylate cyclase (GGDEF)-like protein
MPDFAKALAETACMQPGFKQLAMRWHCSAGEEQWHSGALSPALEAAIGAPELRLDGEIRDVGATGMIVGWNVPSADGWFALAIDMDSPEKGSQHGDTQADRIALRRLLACARDVGAALLERYQLRERVKRLEKAERLQAALYAIADMASSQMEMQDMLRGLHQIVGGLMYAENFFITLYDAEKQTLRFLYFVDTLDSYVADPDSDLPIEELPNSLTVAMIQHGKPVMGPSDDIREELGVIRDPQHGPDSEVWLGVPMLRGEEVRGGIVVQSYDRRVTYSEEDSALLSYVAQHILTALERKHEQSELERRVRERTRELASTNIELRSEVLERQRAERLQATLYRIAELSIVADTLEEFYAAVHAEVDELLYARNFFIALISDDGENLDFPYSVDERDPVRVRRKIARGLTEYVLRSGHALLADREIIQQLVDADEVHSIGTPSVCWLGVPLVRDDVTVGVIAVQSYSPEIVFTLRDQELLTFVSFHIASGLERKRSQESLKAAYAELEHRVVERTSELAAANSQLRGQISERERAEERLTYQAMHDSLTGLPNRARLLDRMQRAMAVYQRSPERSFAVLFLDLDRFKVVNDSVGHLVGDELLKQASRCIAAAVRLPDTVSRLGGDEFAVLVEEISGPSDACEVAGRIIEALAAPFQVAGKELFTSASIGIAMVGPHYRRPEEMLRDADVAMYRAKNRGRNRYELFDEALRHEALRVHDLESDLRRAIAAGQFEPYFQPIVRLSDGVPIGYEALLRWRHEQRGVLLPAEFLTVAEDSGLIEQIDWQMFEAACQNHSNIARNGEYVSINVSPRHFHTPELAERLLALAHRYSIPPGGLRIELTEGALLDDSQLVRSTLDKLHRGNISAQLDDFGTGYSALSYLHRFPIGALKIDRSFVADLGQPGGKGSEAVVKAILALANSLDIEVVGEGVETEAQRRILIELGCLQGQGFFFAHPQPARLFEVA